MELADKFLDTVIDFTLALNGVSVYDLREMEGRVNYVMGLIPDTKIDEMDLDDLEGAIERSLTRKLS